MTSVNMEVKSVYKNTILNIVNIGEIKYSTQTLVSISNG